MPPCPSHTDACEYEGTQRMRRAVGVDAAMEAAGAAATAAEAAEEARATVEVGSTLATSYVSVIIR